MWTSQTSMRYVWEAEPGVDMAAKESLNLDITASQVPYTDLQCHINHFISHKWQERWSSCPDN